MDPKLRPLGDTNTLYPAALIARLVSFLFADINNSNAMS
jgi:hypothetical protein